MSGTIENRKTIEDAFLKISAPRVLLRFGYPSAVEVPQKDLELLRRLVPQMNALCAPKIIVGELAVIDRSANALCLSGSVIVESKSLTKIMNGAKRVSLFAGTIGPAIEEKSTQAAASDKNYREAMLWDAFGSEAAETLARHISNIVRQRARASGFRTTMRFSPGYGDLSLEFNRTILDLLDAQAIGITATDAFTLIPRKSITGLIGWISSKNNNDSA